MSTNSDSESKPQVQSNTVTLLTPPGRGAVAVLAINGPLSIECTRMFFHPASDKIFSRHETGRPYYGMWRSTSDEYQEDVIVWIRNEVSVEVHCHGGDLAWRQIVRDLERQRIQFQSWREYRRSGKQTPIVLEAMSLLPDARTAKCAAILLDQYEGALDAEIETIIHLVNDRQIEPAKNRLDALIETARTGLHLTRPFQIVLCGAPNVGKSSLINRILGYQRAIVFDVPGTTRDVISDVTALDGWPVEISDTVGIRETDSSVESSGMHRTRLVADGADLIVQVVEWNDDPSAIGTLGLFDTSAPSIVVVNKVDLLGQKQLNDLEGANVNLVSAKSGVGIQSLMSALVNQLVKDQPTKGAAIIFSTRQLKWITLARAALDQNKSDRCISNLESLVFSAP